MAIISISGKIGSGKDLTGQIIQYLTNPFDRDLQTKFDINDDYSVANRWQIKKFADKLKDITCLILGFNREQLEDREFKEKELGEEWAAFEAHYQFKIKNFKFRDSKLFLTKEKAQELIENLEYKDETTIIKRILTPRLFMQLLGTEAGREILHPNIWVNSLMNEYKGLENKFITGNYWKKCVNCKKEFTAHKFQNQCEECNNKDNPKYPNWIITDLRFPNEYDAVKEKGGITIRVNRPRKGFTNEKLLAELHPSETALDNHQFDYVIDNSGSIEELIKKVREILTQEKII
jgi:dephospho-CoA kinase